MARLWPVLALGLSALVALVAPGCLEQRDTPALRGENRCASCHGDPTRAGDYILRAAPPHDLLGSTEVSYPGVGAHQLHLRPSATHAAIACDECHRIPEEVGSPGHADSEGPAELTFGALSRTGGRHPAYEATRTCSDTYCHRGARAVWNAPRDSTKACGSCHGLPPAAPHPASERCSACHGQVVDDDRHFLRPDLHVNGKVEFDPSGCTTCHGSGDDPAPPADTHGNADSSFAGVGAHQAHLRGSAIGRPLACAECHPVPDRVDAPGHVDGAVDVVLRGVATSGGHGVARFDSATATCTDTWCHGGGNGGHAASPPWTNTATLRCGACHGDPPAAPHPQMAECSVCHGDVVAADDRTIRDLSRHIDGHVDVTVAERCTTCHGDENAAPPRDTEGHTSTRFAGVGAHQTHVLGTARSRAVPCDECHRVPKTTLDDGHLDSARPAEVRLSGTAAAYGGEPVYAGGTCRDTSCHGARFPQGDPSGGTRTAPTWTKVDGTEASCGACHGLPPPAPHPLLSLNPVCSACHEDIAPDNATFVRPELHVDGVVTFQVR